MVLLSGSCRSLSIYSLFLRNRSSCCKSRRTIGVWSPNVALGPGRWLCLTFGDVISPDTGELAVSTMGPCSSGSPFLTSCCSVSNVLPCCGAPSGGLIKVSASLIQTTRMPRLSTSCLCLSPRRIYPNMSSALSRPKLNRASCCSRFGCMKTQAP